MKIHNLSKTFVSLFSCPLPNPPPPPQPNPNVHDMYNNNSMGWLASRTPLYVRFYIHVHNKTNTRNLPCPPEKKSFFFLIHTSKACLNSKNNKPKKPYYVSILSLSIRGIFFFVPRQKTPKKEFLSKLDGNLFCFFIQT